MEKIYTIPVNEAFEASAADHACGCPFCALYNKLELNEIDIILGASMMEPDIRIETNKKGFCKEHLLRRFLDLTLGLKQKTKIPILFLLRNPENP